MNSFAISSLLTGIFTIVLGFVVFLGNPKKRLNQTWLGVSVFISFWTLGLFGSVIAQNAEQALIAQRILYIGTAMIPAVFLHYSIVLTQIKSPKYWRVITYSVSIIFAVMSFTPLMITGVAEKTYFDYWPINTGPIYEIFIAYFIIAVSFSIFLMNRARKKSLGLKSKQLQYMMVASLIGFIGGSSNFVLDFNLNIFPVGNYFVFLYTLIMAFAIIKHRLFDIRFIVTRSVIYGLLLSVVALSFISVTFVSATYFSDTPNSKLISSLIVAILIVFGFEPFKRAISSTTDKIFYKGRINYQNLLRSLSETLNYEVDQNSIIKKLRATLIQELKIKSAATLLKKKTNTDVFRYEALPDLLLRNPSLTVRKDSALVRYLKNTKRITVYESLERKIEDALNNEKTELNESKKTLEKLNAALAAPIFAQGELIAILVLGQKLSGDTFSNDDLNFIEVLSPQIGSAIQKANLFQEVKEFSAGLQVKVEEATIELRERNTSLTTLQSLTKEITKNLDFNTVVQEIADAVANKLGYMGAILVFLDDDGVTVRARAVTNTPLTEKAVAILGRPFQNFVTRLDDPEHANLAHQVLIHGEIMMSASMAQVLTPPIPKEVTDGMQKLLGIKTMVLVPINAEGKTIGCIEIGVQKEPEHISRQELDTMQSMADELGVVARNLKLFAQIQNTNRKLEDANRHLQQLDQAKSEFVSIASHQLRTPMTGIKGYLSMLADGDFGKLAPEHVKIMRELLGESDRMIRLINQFLNVSKIEAGKFTYAKVPVKLDELVEQQVNELKKVATDKKLTLEYKKLRKAIPAVKADPDKLEDVVLNLIDNAIKYTPSGGTVKVSVTATPNEVEFCVKDSGIGIKSTDAPELFNKFVRGSGIAQIHPDGSGLGLFIAKSIIDAHGGRVWAESEGEGKGSSFKFTLPLA